ncbi:MAG: hypothetical protein IJU72_05705 [Bacteroidales bacterium]|nr:hypothetical protein [Bacteroidales bacterium]
MMKRIAILIFISQMSLNLFAQEANSFGRDKKWALAGGIGAFWCPPSPSFGGAMWMQVSYTMPSSLGVFFKAQHAATTKSLDLDKFWPSDLYHSNRSAAPWNSIRYGHENERQTEVFYLFEFGVERSFILGSRHRITPGMSVLYEHFCTWLPTHSWIGEVTLKDGSTHVLGRVDNGFRRNADSFALGFQCEYTFHFANSFFVGLRGHLFYNFSWIEGVTLSPVFGVRF